MYQIQQSTTTQDLLFFMADNIDGQTGKTGLSPTVTLSKNGGSFASPSGAVSEIANGWYKVAGNATDSNTLGPLILHAEASGAVPYDAVFQVVAYAVLSRVDANVTYFGGSAGTFSSGIPSVNVGQWEGSALLPLLGKIIYVATSGNGGSDSNAGTKAAPKLTVNGAVAIALAGDTIKVGAGSFSGAISNSVNNVRFIGNGANSTTLTHSATTFTMSADNCLVSGFKITGSGSSGTGLLFNSNTLGNVVEHCEFDTVFDGVFMSGKSCIIRDCQFGSISRTGVYDQIAISNGAALIENCNFWTDGAFANQDTASIYIASSAAVTVSRCKLIIFSTATVSTGKAILGIRTEGAGLHCEDVHITINYQSSSNTGTVAGIGRASYGADLPLLASLNGVTVEIIANALGGLTPKQVDASSTGSKVGFYGGNLTESQCLGWSNMYPNDGPLKPSVNNRTFDVTATGEGALDLDNTSGALGTSQFDAAFLTASLIASDAITDAKVASDVTIASVTGAVGSVTGAVGSVTGNVGGNVTGSVGSVAGNVGGNVTGSVGSLAAQAKADVNAEVDSALDTAIPGTPTANSVNERLQTIDNAYTATRAGYLDNINNSALQTTVAQTGDSFARIGATGSGLTSLAPSATALSTAVWTSTIAGRIDAAVSTRATPSDVSAASAAVLDALPPNFVDLQIIVPGPGEGQVVANPATVRSAVGLAAADLDAQLDAAATAAASADAKLGTPVDTIAEDIANIEGGGGGGFTTTERAQIMAALSIQSDPAVPKNLTWYIVREDLEMGPRAIIVKNDTEDDLEVAVNWGGVLGDSDAVDEIVAIELLDEDGGPTSPAFSDLGEAEIWMNRDVRFRLSGGTAGAEYRIRMSVGTVNEVDPYSAICVVRVNAG